MRARPTYLVLAVAGGVLPFLPAIPFFRQYGLAPGPLIEQLVATPISSSFATDLFISSIVFWAFLLFEGGRLGMRYRWLLVVANLTIGLSFALPLFLYLRERHLKGSAPRQVD